MKDPVPYQIKIRRTKYAIISLGDEMIQFIGESTLYFKPELTPLESLKKDLKKRLKRFDILACKSSEANEELTIKFIMHMEEIYTCRTINDYTSYTYRAFRDSLPKNVHATYVKVYDISFIKGRNAMKHHLASYHNIKLGDNY